MKLDDMTMDQLRALAKTQMENAAKYRMYAEETDVLVRETLAAFMRKVDEQSRHTAIAAAKVVV